MLLAYYQGVPLDDLPYLEVIPGIHELRRSHSGFETSHAAIAGGAATRAAGPGTRSAAADCQAANELGAPPSPQLKNGKPPPGGLPFMGGGRDDDKQCSAM